MRQDRRQAYRRDIRPLGQARRRMVRDGAGGVECSKRDRRPHPQGDPRAADLPARRRPQYLTLSRSSGTLSGGEPAHPPGVTDRLRLTGVLYVLDEPSIGLHQRDNARLLDTLKRLRDLGNTVVVVEHDEDAIRLADYVLDIGPGAGMHGGHIVAEGTPDQIMRNPKSLTGKYLTGELSVPVPTGGRRTTAAPSRSSTPAATI